MTQQPDTRVYRLLGTLLALGCSFFILSPSAPAPPQPAEHPSVHRADIVIPRPASRFFSRQDSPVPSRPLLLPGQTAEDDSLLGREEPDGRNDWFLFERSYPYESPPDEARQRAWELSPGRRSGRGVRPQAASIAWQPIGPSPTASAFDNLGMQSGRINSIAISPSDSRIILVGSGTGGIWRSSDRGATFTPVSDNQVDLAVGSIAFSRSNPSVAYAGMGDTKNSYLGTGVLKSTDAGQSWRRVSNNTLPTPGTVSDIEVDPGNPNRVYLAQFTRLVEDGTRSSSGFYQSTDGGINWNRTFAAGARDVTIDVADSRVLYLGISRSEEATAPQAGLYKSTDRGSTWEIIYPTPYNPELGTRDLRIAVTPADPQRLCVLTGGTIGTTFDMRLVVSTDGGSTWTNRGSSGVDSGQFGYNTYIAVDPNNPSTIYIGTRDIYKSTDGGAVWTNLTRNYSPFEGGGYFFNPLSASSHADQHALAFSPANSNEIYVANDGGVSRSTNGGTTFTSLNESLSLTQFISIAVHPTDSSISFGGSQDNGTQRRRSAFGWKEFVSGDGGRCVINPLDPSIAWFTYIRGDIFRFLDNGQTFDGRIGSNGKFLEPDIGGRIAFYPPFSGNGVDDTLYFGTWRLFISTDLGTNWTPPAGDLDLTKGITPVARDVLNAIGVSRSDPRVIYTGSAQGRAMVTTDAGATWRDITAGLPDRTIKSITVDATNPALAYLTASGFNTGHIFKTTDTGATWTDISGNLPNIPVNAMLVDPLIPEVIYLGTDIGVFRSISSGGNWEEYNDGMPPVVVNAFASQSSGLIQLATYGRGAYELNQSRPTVESVSLTSPKVVIIAGKGFGNNPSVFINDVDRTSAIKSASSSQIKLKGKPKKLGLKPGENTIQVMRDGGLLSNVVVLVF